MSDQGQVVKADEIILSPSVSLERAEAVAQSLKKYLDQRKGLVMKIGPSEHLRFEAWDFLGSRFGIDPSIVRTEYVPPSETRPEGFNAVAELVRFQTGEALGVRAEAFCGRDEQNWAKKPLFQLESMAQTRACSKVSRLALSWIVVMGGYQPTPAE